MAKLTDKQQRFVDEYLIDLNATQAAIRAGYNKKTARQIAAQNLSKLNIQEEIEKQQKLQQRRTRITQDMVLRELAAIAFAKSSDYAQIVEKELPTENGGSVMGTVVQFTPTEELTEEQKKALQGIKEGKYGIEVAQCDKVKALELLGRHLGMFKDKVEVSGLEQEKSKLDDLIKQMCGDSG